MITIQQTVEIPADRHLVLDLPPNVPSGQMNMLLVFSHEEAAERPAEKPAVPEDDALRRVLSHKFPTIEELKAEAARKAAEQQAYFEATGRDMLKDIIDSFETTPFEGIDGVEYQRSMRDEWPD
jgi:hypothetical protein